MIAHLPHLRELHHRVTDGIDVRLLWDERDDERALDVFHHPYAYARWRGIDTRGAAQRGGRRCFRPRVARRARRPR